MKNFTQSFDIIYNKFCKIAIDAGAAKRELSQLAMARFLDVSQGKMQAWQKGQWPSAEDLETIARKFGFSYRWLVTGEGDPFGDDTPDDGKSCPRGDADSEKEARIAELEAQLREREQELLETKTEIINLQRRLLDQTTARQIPG